MAITPFNKPWYDVKEYGAVGDGLTNDSTAIQAAITAAQTAGGGVVFFPIGVYKCNTGLTVTAASIIFQGAGWDQTTTTVGSIIKAGGTFTDLINVSSAGERFSMTEMSLDGNGTATNLLTVDALNCQFTRCYGRRPATNGAGFNVTSNGTSAWFTDCRFNGANQAGCVGYAINGTDSTMTGCKAVNCLDSVTYGSTASGGIQQGCHHTPGSTIGRCCINVIGNAANLQFIGNRFDNHALGSGIQISPSANIYGPIITGNLFFQNVITDATFAAIGVDTSSAHTYELNITGNIIRSASSHNYTAMVAAQTLAGTAATNPTRLLTDGTVCVGNTVYAAALYGANSRPQVTNSNSFSTDGATFVTTGDAVSTPPTTGTYAIGDRVWNSAPDTSGNIGWVCTIAGTPGTWKPFGSTDTASEIQNRGFLAWSGPPWGSNTVTMVTQNEVAVKIFIPYNMSVTNCVVIVSTAGNTLTSGQNLVTLYNQAGTKLGSTADQSTNWTGTGTFLLPFSGGPYALTGGPGAYCWVSLLSNGTTPATFRAITSNAPFANVAGTGTGVLTGAALFAGRTGTTITAPATFTPSSLVSTNGATYWIGLS